MTVIDYEEGLINVERIYHTWDEWECYPAGMYETNPPAGMTPDQARDAYTEFLRDPDRFRAGLEGVLRDWPNSTEHYLSNENMNRIAWLGQAAMCYATRVPKGFRTGYSQLTPTEQHAANLLALEYLNKFLDAKGEPTLFSLDDAKSKTQMDLY
jgi:hypothetical protein